MKFVLVESPAKARKIAQFLGAGWQVDACLGHVRDLPTDALGVDVNANFAPQYQVLKGKNALLNRLVKKMREASEVYLATDPDREGEAIAWHLLDVAKLTKFKAVYRVAFSAITKEAVTQAMQNPRPLDLALVEAQHTRRILDRLVGYLASPLASKTLNGKFSAGRVQSACLRLLVEREREIEAFIPKPYWTQTLTLSTENATFTAKLHNLKGFDAPFTDPAPLEKLAQWLPSAQAWVEKARQTLKLRNPHPPFTTSTLQQVASKRLGFSPDKTMNLAQLLYEQGWITYHRTDGLAISPEAQAQTRVYIGDEYGAKYLPAIAPTYKAKSSNAQEAHEAIRPTEIARFVDLDGDGARLYTLIRQRFLASQMSSARYGVTGAVILLGKTQGQPFPLEFRAHGRTLLFDGFLKIYAEDDDETPDDLPPLTDGQVLRVVTVTTDQHFTQPPSRYSEATLIQALEKHGIGRPSTYASMIQTVKNKDYAQIREKSLVPTLEGVRLNDYLTATTRFLPCGNKNSLTKKTQTRGGLSPMMR